MTLEAIIGEGKTPGTADMEPKTFFALDPVVGGEPGGIIPDHLVHTPPGTANGQAMLKHVQERYPKLPPKRAKRSPLLELL